MTTTDADASLDSDSRGNDGDEEDRDDNLDSPGVVLGGPSLLPLPGCHCSAPLPEEEGDNDDNVRVAQVA